MKTTALLVTFGLFVHNSEAVGVAPAPANEEEVEPDFVAVPVDDATRWSFQDTPIACDCYDIQMTLKEELEDRTCYSYTVSKDQESELCQPLRLRNFIMAKDCDVYSDDIVAFTPIDLTVIAEPKRRPIEGIRVNVIEVESARRLKDTEFFSNGDASGRANGDIEFRMCFKPWMVSGEQETSQIAFNMRGTPTKSATCDVAAIFPSFCKTETKVLAAENVCMDLNAYSEDWLFNAPLNGVIDGVELVYTSGSVECDCNEAKWGCNSFSTNFLKMGTSGNTVLYPTTSMDDLDEDAEYATIDSCSPGDCTVSQWGMETTTPSDDTLLLSDISSPYTVTTDDLFSIQYSDACCSVADDSETDTVATVCADVYFYYDSVSCDDDVDDEEPAVDPPAVETAEPTTSDPTREPTLEPTPTADPPVVETAKPTTSDPTSDPTAKPTTSDPTREPTARPTTSDPTSEPTAKPTTSDPTSDPTAKPTTSDPTSDPTAKPTTSDPTSDPTAKPTTSDPTSDPTMRPSLAPTYTVCDTADALNIAFLLDESGSIDEQEWEVVKTFVNRLITFDISPESYVSLFEYATEEAYDNFQNWTKNDGVGQVELTDAMTNNRWNSAGQTYTWWGTSKVLDEFWNYKNSCRDESCTRQDMLIIVTDGTPSDEVCPNIEARMAANDVDVVLIIIGGQDDADTIEQQIGCLDKDGTDILKIDGVESDAFNAIEVFIRAKTCSGSYPAGPETDAGVRYEYCPPTDPVSECTYDLGLGSNVGTGGAGGALDAGQSAHAGIADIDSALTGQLTADYSKFDGVVVLTWSQLLSVALIIIAVLILAVSICGCVARMKPEGNADFKFHGKHQQHRHAKLACHCDSDEEDDEDLMP